MIHLFLCYDSKINNFIISVSVQGKCIYCGLKITELTLESNKANLMGKSRDVKFNIKLF